MPTAPLPVMLLVALYKAMSKQLETVLFPSPYVSRLGEFTRIDCTQTEQVHGFLTLPIESTI